MQLDLKGFRSLNSHTQTIPESPVVVLRGVNGSGKSTLRRVLLRLLGDTSATPELARDASRAEARLTHDGHTINLKLASRFSLTGSAPIRLAAGEGRLLSDLIGPDDDDRSTDAAARKARVDALARLAGLTPTDAVLRSLLPENMNKGELGMWKTPDDFMGVVAELKRRIEGAARNHKSDYDCLSGQVAQLNRTIANHPTGDASAPIATLQATCAGLERAFYQAEAGHKARLEAETQRARLNTSLPAPTFRVCANYANGVAEMAGQPVTKESIARMANIVSNLAAHVQQLPDALKTYDQMLQTLNTPITGPTSDDVAAAADRLSQARVDLERAQGIAARVKLEAELEKVTEQMIAAGEQELAHRQAAQGIAGKLAGLIRAAKLETLSLDENGEVIANTPAGWQPYATLSFGERVYQAITALVGTEKLEPGDDLVILSLSPSHWASLDFPARQMIAMDLARFNGRVILLTEEPGDNDGIITETLT